MAKGMKYTHRAIRAVLLGQMNVRLDDAEKRKLLSLLEDKGDSQDGKLVSFFTDFKVEDLWDQYDVHDGIQLGSTGQTKTQEEGLARNELKEFANFLDKINDNGLKTAFYVDGSQQKLQQIPKQEGEDKQKIAKSLFAARLIELGKSEEELKRFGFNDNDIKFGCEQYITWLQQGGDQNDKWVAKLFRETKLPKGSLGKLFDDEASTKKNLQLAHTGYKKPEDVLDLINRGFTEAELTEGTYTHGEIVAGLKLYLAQDLKKITTVITDEKFVKATYLQAAYEIKFYLPNDVADLIDSGVTNDDFKDKYTEEEVAAGLKAYLARDLTLDQVKTLIGQQQIDQQHIGPQNFDLAAIHKALPADETRKSTIINLLKESGKGAKDFIEAGYSRAELPAAVNDDIPNAIKAYIQPEQQEQLAPDYQKDKIKKLKNLHKKGFTTIADVSALIKEPNNNGADGNGDGVSADEIGNLILAGYSKDELRNALVDVAEQPAQQQNAAAPQPAQQPQQAQGANAVPVQGEVANLTPDARADEDIKVALQKLIEKCSASLDNEFEELGRNLKRQGFDDATIMSALQSFRPKDNQDENVLASIVGASLEYIEKIRNIAALVRAGFDYNMLNDQSVFGGKPDKGWFNSTYLEGGLSELLAEATIVAQKKYFDRTKLDQSSEFDVAFQKSLSKFLAKEKLDDQNQYYGIISKLISCRCKKGELLKAGVKEEALLSALNMFIRSRSKRISREALAVQGFTAQEIQKALRKAIPVANNNNDGVATIKALIDGGFSYAELMAIPGMNDDKLKGALPLNNLIRNRAPEFISKLHENGYPASLLKNAGYVVQELKSIYTYDELIAGGFSEKECKMVWRRFDYNTTQSNITPLVSAAIEGNGGADIADIYKFAEAFYGEKLWKGMTKSDVPILDIQALNKMTTFMLGLDLKVLAKFLESKTGQDEKPLTESSSSLFANLWDTTTDKDNPHGKFKSGLAKNIPGEWQGFLKELFENADDNIKNKLTFAQLAKLPHVEGGVEFNIFAEVMRKTQRSMGNKLQTSIANQLAKLQDPKNTPKPNLEEIQKLQRTQLAVMELESIRARQNFQEVVGDFSKPPNQSNASKLNNIILLLQNAQRQFITKCYAVTAKDGGVEKIKKLIESNSGLFDKIVPDDDSIGLNQGQKAQLKSAFEEMMSQTEQMQIVLYEQGIFREVDYDPETENKDKQQDVTDEDKDSEFGVSIMPLGRNIQEGHFKIQKDLAKDGLLDGVITYDSATKTITMPRVKSSKWHPFEVEEKRKQYAKAAVEAAIAEGWGRSGITITVYNHKDHIKQAKYIIDEATKHGIKVTIAAASGIPSADKEHIENEDFELNKYVKESQKNMEEGNKEVLGKGEVNKKFGDFFEEVQKLITTNTNGVALQTAFDERWGELESGEKRIIVNELIKQMKEPSNQLAAKISSMIVVASLVDANSSLKIETGAMRYIDIHGEWAYSEADDVDKDKELYQTLYKNHAGVLQDHIKSIKDKYCLKKRSGPFGQTEGSFLRDVLLTPAAGQAGKYGGPIVQSLQELVDLGTNANANKNETSTKAKVRDAGEVVTPPSSMRCA